MSKSKVYDFDGKEINNKIKMNKIYLLVILISILVIFIIGFLSNNYQKKENKDQSSQGYKEPKLLDYENDLALNLNCYYKVGIIKFVGKTKTF